MSALVDWSVSRAELWRACPRQYLLIHVLRARPAIATSRDRGFGIVTHRAIQAAYAARASGSAPVDGQPGRMDGYLRNVLDALDDVDAPLRQRRDVAAAVAALLRRLPAPHPTAILGVEHSFELTHDGVRTRGVIDYAVRTGPSSIHVRDWKTGAVDSDPESLEGNLQMSTYDDAAHALWPWATTVTVGLYAVRQLRETIRELSRETVTFFRARSTRDALAVQDAVARVNADTVDDLFPARSGRHCGACVMRPYCPLFRDASLPLRGDVDVAAERHRMDTELATRR